MAQRLSNTKAKITGVRIHKARSDSTIASVTVNQCEFLLPHFPGLLQDLGECPVEHDFRGMIAMKVNLHPSSPGQNYFRANDYSNSFAWPKVSVQIGTLNPAQCLSDRSRLRGVVVCNLDISLWFARRHVQVASRHRLREIETSASQKRYVCVQPTSGTAIRSLFTLLLLTIPLGGECREI